ncbi:acyl-CoA dehydrogenase [Marinobacterium nitratireducens]|uniref:3-methylmercaptopropionyl-CoA dehydrogenase n=1 Tax=Marinobacterium nitratireducens TaxID=518897 RepID=A0A917ZJS3_9GAMM|nr:acyl-CoA dehydrogenase family protein [Marinobacterium nitratireducens]GGO83434.1 acyl-CoA dehydrogenase [Marinobacterium nitratireducens]
MSNYTPPLRDMQFVIEEWLAAPDDWAGWEAHSALDAELAAQVLVEAAKFAQHELAPLNASGDQQGCRFDNGVVSTPAGFPESYRLFVEGGWPSLCCAEEDGGQGLPQLLNVAMLEMLASANHAWAMYPGIAQGAYECLSESAPAWIRERYLPEIVSGEALPTMCLTEPQAGTDIGLIRTKAEPQPDGSCRLRGNKIFISGGEQDMTDDILHLVLARLPEAPPGPRGLSLFLVPKWLDREGGRERNEVYCTGIEHKMGIRGSATCSLSFEGATGWLLGEPHAGLKAMFVMMNSARLHVGLQGLGHAEKALQLATGYAAERRQMRAASRPQGVAAAAVDPIGYHAPVRHSLLELRACTEGMRALGYWTGHMLDTLHQVGEEEAAGLRRRVALLTPVIKAFFSEQGFRLSSNALQVFGGYGYMQECGIEQTLRDSRIVMIYEGTNEVQANDLLLRKVMADGGEGLRDLLALVRQEAELATADRPRFARQLSAVCDTVEEAVGLLLDSQDSEYPFRAAGNFLRLLALLLMAYAWARSARVAEGRDDDFHRQKRQTAAFFFDYVLPEYRHRADMIRAAQAPLPFV